MVTAREIKNRIESIGNVQKITSTMKAVASAKLNRVRDRMENARPFAREIEDSIRELISRNPEISHPYFAPEEEDLAGTEPEADRPGYLVLSGDRGLCGSYNHNVFRHVEGLIKEHRERGDEPSLYVVGKRGVRHFRTRDVHVEREFEDLWDDLNYVNSLAVTRALVDGFETGNLTSVGIVFTEFESPMVHKVKPYPLLPLTREEFEKEELDLPVDFLYEPDARDVVDHLFPRHVRTQVYQAMLESYASEQAARMVAMDNATENADEMIDDLTLEYNQVRQASITRQIAEISGGAEALKE